MGEEMSAVPVSRPPALPVNELKSDATGQDDRGGGGSGTTQVHLSLVICLPATGSHYVAQAGLEFRVLWLSIPNAGIIGM